MFIKGEEKGIWTQRKSTTVGVSKRKSLKRIKELVNTMNASRKKGKKV